MNKTRMLNLVYYRLKPVLPRVVQIWGRRLVTMRRREKYRAMWPILEKAGSLPENWPGWPVGKSFAVVLTHDVETSKGQEKCLDLMRLEQRLGFRSSFNFVPERYKVSPKILNELVDNGFEIGVHGLKHDGKLFESWKTFQERARKINGYLAKWNAVGFRSPAMHHNLEWLRELDIEYDSSTFDTDPFEPQPNGAGTVFPFRFPQDRASKGYMELPCTLPQDFTLFILMREKDISIWKRKLDWIAQKGGMALVDTHPDYMSFQIGGTAREEFPVEYYLEFLRYVRDKYTDRYWHVLPREAASFCRNTMTCV